MDQNELNKANLTEWEYDNKYEKLFDLPLTSKHALSVGKWESSGFKGVDLRRWSYDQSRNLGEGITLFENLWLKIYSQIVDLFNKDLFSTYINSNESKYIKEYKIDRTLKVLTGTYVPPGMRNKYFCMTMLKNGNVVYRGKYAAIRIMFRFETVNDLIIKCKEHGLVPSDIFQPDGGIDGTTGKKIF